MKKLSGMGRLALLLSSSLTIMVGTAIAPSLTEISKHLGFAKSPGWLITLPSLGVVLFAPFVGKLIDQKGPYVIMLWGLIPYAVLGTIGAVLRNPYLIIIDRLLLGGATAAVQASGTGLIAALFHGKARMKMIAWQGMSIELGGVVFLSIGGLLGELGWQYPFFIYLIGLVCAFLIVRTINLQPAPVAQHDESTDTRISLKLVVIIINSAFAMILFFVAFVGLPVYLTEVFHYSESAIGYFMAFISLIAVVAAGQMPKVVRKFSEFRVVATGFLFFMAGLGTFYLANSLLMLFIAALCMGIGFGFTIPLLNHMTLEESRPSNRGRNLGLYSMGVFGGQFLSSFITEISSDVALTFLNGAVLAFVVAIMLLLVTGKSSRFKIA
ncbi:MFS transporter [Chitinophaga flava]|uniref:MFS transporter n=1 Tax=Chitinophaga flava TaxID=2259036 RepID=A0A365XZ34_9BACT|nr:MFS transporter [Chitinophaga flava]RBL90944.1 MFS transporter [Chitinophaga flava]